MRKFLFEEHWSALYLVLRLHQGLTINREWIETWGPMMLLLSPILLREILRDATGISKIGRRRELFPVGSKSLVPKLHPYPIIANASFFFIVLRQYVAGKATLNCLCGLEVRCALWSHDFIREVTAQRLL